MNKKNLFVLFGPPGSGKTVLGLYMAKTLKLHHLSWGLVYYDTHLRDKYSEKFKIIDSSKNDTKRSKIIAELVELQIKKLPKDSKGLILDGFPKRLREAESLVNIMERNDYNLKALIRINPSAEKALKRFNNRFICNTCSRHYDIEFNPPPQNNVCDYDGGSLKTMKIVPQKIKTQFGEYMRESLPAFNMLRKHSNMFFSVSGDDDELIVFSKILMKLQNSERDDYQIYRRRSSTSFHTKYGLYNIFTYQSEIDYSFHLALVKGKIEKGRDVFTRVHSSCITGDIFGSKQCDCGPQLDRAMRLIERQGRGVIIYLFQEGRGINIINKVKAYKLQNLGMDTVEANEKLGFPSEMRQYTAVKDILSDLRIKTICLLTNNPDKVRKITDLGVIVESTKPLEVEPNQHSKKYLTTKKVKMNHSLVKV